MRTPEPKGSHDERPGISVSKPGVLLFVLILTVTAAGYGIYWLIRSARG